MKYNLLEKNMLNFATEILYNHFELFQGFKASISLTLNKFGLLVILAIRCQRTLFLPPENIRKPRGFLMFSGGRERVHWE